MSFINMIKNIKYIPLGIWFYYDVRKIKKNRIAVMRERANGDFEKERIEIIKTGASWGKSVTKKFKVDLHVEGIENIPEGSVLFASNHQGYMDIPVFFSAIDNKQFGFVAKDGLSKIPVFSEVMKEVRSIFIKRDDPRASLKTINEGVELLKNGFSLAIFPEGTRSKSSKTGEFKKGSLRLATKSKVPVVPVSIGNSYKVFEEKGRFVKNVKINFVIHRPIETKDLDKKGINDLYETVENVIIGGIK